MINFEMIEIIAPALIVGLMICAVHGALGIKVLQRGIIFIDLAIAQIAGFGLILCGVLFENCPGYVTQIFALIFALSAAIFFYFVEKKAPKQQEAIIGSSFILFASLAILLLANDPHGDEEIKHLLSGQILFVTWSDIFSHLPIYVLIMAAWFLRPKVQGGIAFYLIFALAITSSVQLVGIYVVFASLILPALAALNYKNPLLTSWFCGFTSVILGIFLALIFDLPAGGLIVISYVMVTCLFKLVNMSNFRR